MNKTAKEWDWTGAKFVSADGRNFLRFDTPPLTPWQALYRNGTPRQRDRTTRILLKLSRRWSSIDPDAAYRLWIVATWIRGTPEDRTKVRRLFADAEIARVFDAWLTGGPVGLVAFVKEVTLLEALYAVPKT